MKPRYPVLEDNINADVVIIGGGLAGLSTAYELLKSGVKGVAVLESRALASGQTGRDAGMVIPWFDDSYSRLLNHFKAETVRLVAQAQRDAIDRVEEIVQAEGIDCNFKRVDGYLYAHDEDAGSKRRLDAELQACHTAGVTALSKVNLEGGAEVGAIRDAVRFPGAAQLDPIKYTEGLADAVTRMGGKIYEHSHVTKILGGTVKVSNGSGVSAKHVVYACQVPAYNLNVLVLGRQQPFKQYHISVKIPKGKFKAGAQFWSTSDPPHFFRVVEQPKADHDLLVVAGAAHRVGKLPEQMKDYWAMTHQYVVKRWPDAKEVVDKWTKQYMQPIDYLYLAGKDPLNALNLPTASHWTITGDSNQQMSAGTIAGMILASAIQGKQHKYAKVFAPTRFPPDLSTFSNSITGYVKTNVQSLLDHIIPTRGGVDAVAPGTGAVLQHGVRKVAVYCDDDGKRHVYSAACPHLGCCVKWNVNEKTFDCPCHGSNFDRYGRVINAPAKKDLAPIEW